MVADLRIDNRMDLVARLGISAARSDADILLALWEQYGLDAFDRVEGEFAAAIFDLDGGRLVLAVDAVAQRELHYSRRGDAVAFATTPLSLARWRGTVAPDLSKLSAHLLSFGDIGSNSFLEGVERVRPGHVVIADSPGDCREQRWWTPDLSPIQLSFQEAVEAVRSELAHAVRTQVRESNPIVATQLSGGLDSSSVAVTATEVLDPHQSLIAITGEPVGRLEYDSPKSWFGDEVTYAVETAAMLPRTRHVRVRVEPCSPFRGMERWMAATQSPLANACNSAWVDATYAAAAESGATQMLTGILGNSTISHSGYHLLRQALLNREWDAVAGEMRALRRRGASWPGIAFMTIAAAAPRLMGLMFSELHGKSRAEAYRFLLLHPNSGHVVAAEQARRRHEEEVVRLYSRAQRIAAERLAGIQLVRTSGEFQVARRYHGIELLDPTAARRVIELCLRLPENYSRRDGETRSIARALLRGKIPDRVVNEYRKAIQGANWRAGFEAARPAMVAELDAVDQQSELAELLDVPRMQATLRAWPQDNWEDGEQVQLYRSNLMRGIGAARFVRWLREGARGAE